MGYMSLIFSFEFDKIYNVGFANEQKTNAIYTITRRKFSTVDSEYMKTRLSRGNKRCNVQLE